ncbi:MAG: LamG-like jellyroll fold domain-containing protein [Bacteroidota bacterium]
MKKDVFYFVTVTVTNNNKEGRAVSFFVNGKEYAARQYINYSTDDAFNGSNYKTFIGAYTNEGPVDLNSFTGVLDDIRIYNRVLGSHEVNTLYDHVSFEDTLFIVEQPEDAGVYPGSKHELNTLGFGKNLHYQWFRNDVEIQDADSNIFIVDNMSEADTGSYFCKIFNSSDTVFTDTVILTCDFKSALVAYYPFNGNANDSSVNNNHGSVNGAQLDKDALARENSAYHFDGQDDYIELSEAIVLENELTISSWVKFDSLPGRQATIFSTRQQCASSSRGWSPSCLYYKPDHGLMYTVYETTNCFTGSSSDDYRADGFFPEENKYYFFTVTVKNNNKESRTVRFFVNGKEYPMVQVRDHGSVQAFNATNYKSLIGLYTYGYSTGTYPFTGVIDELSIYNRALEPELIDSVYRDIYDADTIILINQPEDKRIKEGSKLHLEILAMGKSINYQWYKDGQILMGNTSCSLIVDEMAIEDTGSYFCKIFNDTDTVFTDTAQITYYLEEGLLAYYPFNGNANDASGNNFHGTVNGAILTNDVKGDLNSAYYFDGNAYINCGDDSLLNQDFKAFTLTAWIYPEHINEDVRIINNRGKGAFSGNYAGYQMKIMNSDNKWGFHESAIQDNSSNAYYLDSSKLNDYGKWYHVAMVYSNPNIYFLVNGEIVDSLDDGGLVDISNDLPTVIGSAIAEDGSLTGTPAQSFKGIVDEVKIYDKALGAEDISMAYQAERNIAPDEGLLVWYPFNSDAKDASGNGFHGTVTNAQLVDDPQVPGNKAYYFDGVDAHVNAGDSPELELVDNFTLQAWIKPNGFTDNDMGSIINKEGEYDFRVTPTGYLNYVFYTSLAGWTNTSTGISIDDRQWSLITITFSNKILKAYKNDQMLYTSERSNVISGDRHPDENELHIGGRQHGSSFFKGLIDEVKIYKRVLDSTEISNAYNRGRSTQGQVIDVYDTVRVEVFDTVTVTDTLLIDVEFSSVDGLKITTIKIYPNPANDIVYISLQDENVIRDHTIKIMDVSGKVIHESTLDTDMTEISLDSFGKEGLYFIQILDDSMQIIDTRKIILK